MQMFLGVQKSLRDIIQSLALFKSLTNIQHEERENHEPERYKRAGREGGRGFSSSS